MPTEPHRQNNPRLEERGRGVNNIIEVVQGHSTFIVPYNDDLETVAAQYSNVAPTCHETSAEKRNAT